ncbi:hypothetical protein NMY22_g9265 [Coprinellus aureogranulatus]|nr:hypothetical protein NMY22_g9265 [Coprinellus aureogranulatus]
MTGYPCPQATTTTFNVPPLDDGSLTLPAIYEFHDRHNATYPIFYWSTDDGVECLTWSRAYQGFNNIARLITDAEPSGEVEGPPTVVAILAVVDQPSYFGLVAGIIRAGFIAFPISPRNSAAAVADMLQKAGATMVFVSDDKQMRTLAASVQEILAREGHPGMKLLDVPHFDAIYRTSSGDSHLPPISSVRKTSKDSPALILHSSGSTSFPKPIFLTHRILIEWGLAPYFGEVDISGRVAAMHCLPLLHAIGTAATCWAMTTGVILAHFAPKVPPHMPTPDSVFKCMQATSSNILFCVPAFLEDWALEKDKVAQLRNLDAIVFGGGPISSEAGNILHKEGCKVGPMYGSTEQGTSSQFIAQSPESGWDYFRLSPQTSPELVLEEGYEATYRLFYKVSPHHHPAVLNCERDGVAMYDTRDILAPHPSVPGLWKIHGRADDQIIHSTGEKAGSRSDHSCLIY